MNIGTKNSIAISLVGALFSIGSMIKMSCMIGSFNAHFSCMYVVAPLLGVFLSAVPATFCLGGLFILRSLVCATCVTCGVPTLFAMLSWNYAWATTKRLGRIVDFMLHVVVPFACMIIFMAMTTGVARVYSLFWVIPIAIYAARQYGYKNIFSQALASTFLAHAVGSIMWVFAVPMTEGQWIALIPVVVIERLLYASATVGVLYGVRSCSNVMLPLGRRLSSRLSFLHF